ncbi:hypothetical protein JTE90_002607 [Oedothorax gibbosus]|uniref:Uncharacterized protein n=1 Tax=Oedothorax gibbosus TaxID=931172 RepID=A0AAV6V459_9ARAC|nr:hypothetical protein JTE90_002607 [Oedothorax gibbosus]
MCSLGSFVPPLSKSKVVLPHKVAAWETSRAYTVLGSSHRHRRAPSPSQVNAIVSRAWAAGRDGRERFPIPDQSAETVATASFPVWVSRFGCPKPLSLAKAPIF